MAKSARASTVKTNNQRLKSKVFGPVEAARAERLSAKLLELAAAPKPERDVEMEVVKDEGKPLATKSVQESDVDRFLRHSGGEQGEHIGRKGRR